MRHRGIVTIALAAAVLAAGPAAAAAHTEVKSTSPKRGKTVGKSVRSVKVTFTQAIQRGSLRVTGPGGRTVSKGSGGRDPRKVSRLRVGLKGSLASGRYRVRWTITAADGHRQTGKFKFRVR